MKIKAEELRELLKDSAALELVRQEISELRNNVQAKFDDIAHGMVKAIRRMDTLELGQVQLHDAIHKGTDKAAPEVKSQEEGGVVWTVAGETAPVKG